MITVEDIRKSLRISHDKLNDDISRTMNACLLDMERVGIQKTKQDALTDRAIILFCRSEFDFQGKGQQYQQSYEKLRDALSLSGDYQSERRID